MHIAMLHIGLIGWVGGYGLLFHAWHGIEFLNEWGDDVRGCMAELLRVWARAAWQLRTRWFSGHGNGGRVALVDWAGWG